MKKLRIGVIYGGRSGEHEVSIASAAAVFKHLDRSRYEPVAIRIDRDGRWSLPDRPPAALAAAEVIEQARTASALSVRPGREAHLVAYPSDDTVLTIDRRKGDDDERAQVTGLGLDVVFPGPARAARRGRNGPGPARAGQRPVCRRGGAGLGRRDGQGVHEGARSQAHGLPVGEFRTVLAHQWRADREASAAALERLGFPLFVKPANMGSSVGISKAKTVPDLLAAMELALQFDRKVVVEAAVPAAREIEVRGAGQRRAGGLGAGGSRDRARVLRLRGEVPRRGFDPAHPGHPRREPEP